MLWYLHLASSAKIVVHRYTDDPLGMGEVHPDGSNQFVSATLRPSIVVANGTDLEQATALHHDVHRYCFIARSVHFPITYAATFEVLEG
jgi:organic hydroperoxide reductase OsmC/OhrA